MKKLLGNNFKVVNYFGVELMLDTEVKYLVTTKDGDIVASKHTPELDPQLGWLYDYDAHSEFIAVVDLEGMDWKDTLMEVK